MSDQPSKHLTDARQRLVGAFAAVTLVKISWNEDARDLHTTAVVRVTRPGKMGPPMAKSAVSSLAGRPSCSRSSTSAATQSDRQESPKKKHGSCWLYLQRAVGVIGRERQRLSIKEQRNAMRRRGKSNGANVRKEQRKRDYDDISACILRSRKTDLRPQHGETTGVRRFIPYEEERRG